MLNLKFKLNPRHVMHKTDEFYTNGSWMVRRSYLKTDKGLDRAFAPLAPIANGSYRAGYKSERTSETAPDCQRIIPSLSDYKPARLSGKANVGFNCIGEVEIESEDQSTKAVINPEYLPLLALGRIFVAGPTRPIVVVAVDDTVAALVMPLRSTGKTKGE